MSAKTKTQITIFGSYNSNSIGDKAILVSLIDLIFRNSEHKIGLEVLSFDKTAIEEELKNFPWYKNVSVNSIGNTKSSNAKKKNLALFSRISVIIASLPHTLQTVIGLILFNNTLKKYSLRNSKALIIGGGNLLMDMYPMWPARPYILSNLFLKNKRPTMIIGVGAFPIRTPFSKFLFKRLIRSAVKVYVRDYETQEYIAKFWRKDVIYHPDLALSYPIPETFALKRESNVVAVNIAPVYGKNWPYKDPNKYKDFITNLANVFYSYYLMQSEQKTFYFFDTNYPTDRTASLDLISELESLGIPSKKLIYEDRLLSSQEIIRKVGNSSFAVVTRLHAGIMAARTSTPIIAIEYQPKVRTVLQAAGMNNPHVFVNINHIKDLKESLVMLASKPEAFTLSPKQLHKLDSYNNTVVKDLLEIALHNS